MSPSPTALIKTYVGSKVFGLQAGYVERTANAVAGLAALRHAGLTEPGDDPQAWSLLFDGMPSELESEYSDPSRAERAIQSALVLFAHHQTSRGERMHRPKVPIGTAVGTLARARSRGEGLDESTLKRFQSAAMGQTHTSRVRGLRQLVGMMRSDHETSIGFDYGQLAADLYTLQFPDRAPRVRLAWGRALHHQSPQPETTITTPTEEN